MTKPDISTKARTCENMTAKAVKIIGDWQFRLRLQDWKIRVKVNRHFSMPETVCEGGTEAAHLVTHRHSHSAELDIRHPDDTHPETPDAPDMEQSIVHELLHIHLDEWEVEPNTLGYWQKEYAINVIADALVELRKGNEDGRKETEPVCEESPGHADGETAR